MIGAVVLAAGRSQRMGQPKLILPWGDTTIIGRVVSVLATAQIDEIVVVTGGAQIAVEKILRDTPARTVFNPDYANGEMSSTLKVGLRAFLEKVEAALIVLGDQPQIELGVVQSVLEVYRQEAALLVVPSYQMRRGHPWIVARTFWPEIDQISPPKTLRDFLNQHQPETRFVNVNNASILQDLDMPQDYQRFRPR
jgi:molybdenum cofactor cytidylyltransferase